jgi:hypothetical protein
MGMGSDAIMQPYSPAPGETRTFPLREIHAAFW